MTLVRQLAGKIADMVFVKPTKGAMIRALEQAMIDTRKSTLEECRKVLFERAVAVKGVTPMMELLNAIDQIDRAVVFK